jgi:hypothetical protein
VRNAVWDVLDDGWTKDHWRRIWCRTGGSSVFPRLRGYPSSMVRPASFAVGRLGGQREGS